jgi:hypothetical protein
MDHWSIWAMIGIALFGMLAQPEVNLPIRRTIKRAIRPLLKR